MAEIVLDGVTKRYPDGALAVQHETSRSPMASS